MPVTRGRRASSRGDARLLRQSKIMDALGPGATTQYAAPGMRLFRFLRPDTVHFQESIDRLLRKNEIYLSSRRRFNDPFDMNPVFKADWTTDGIRRHIEAILANPTASSAGTDLVVKLLQVSGRPSKEVVSVQNIRSLKQKFPEYMNNLLDKVGVCCFTEELQNSLLWAHYAASYTGICIELRATGDTGHPFCNCMRVHYTEQRPTIYGSQTGAFGTVYGRNWKYIAQYGFCTKSIDWAVEKEWRLWLPDRASTYQTLPADSVRSIFLGPLIPSATSKMVVDWVRGSKQNVKVFRTKLSNMEFKVEIERRLL